MKAHHIMTRKVIKVAPGDSIADAARLMLDNHLSGLPVVDLKGALVGIVTERDLLRRREIGTQRKRPRWLDFILGPGRQAADYVQTAGRRVDEIMTRDVQTVTEDTPLSDVVAIMERYRIKRVPVMNGNNKLTGIISRQNFVRAVAGLARDVPDPTADDSHIQTRILKEIGRHDWGPSGLEVFVRNGVVDICGVITEERTRQAIIVAAENVAGVKQVHDHLCWVDPLSGAYFEPKEEERTKAS
ncbi:MAG: CBS domain-containing protein [Afipia sp.]|jgi:CBS-domain-containing membrane protein|nr:CBS domain-containing protein [Afipia sp.]WIG50476.1 MAG: inosine-5'-monophosphate dehydrogenase [Afipia sp.]